MVQSRCLHQHGSAAVWNLRAQQPNTQVNFDFSTIKRVVSAWIDANLDHRMLLHKDDPVLPELRRQGEPLFVFDVNPTAENIAKLIFEYTASQGFPVTQVALWETHDSFAVYRGNAV